MPVPTIHHSVRRLFARELAALWLTTTAALTYLDVPFIHAPLFSASLLLQALLGVLMITRLLRGVVPSLLLLCGPGLILGGAASFAIFQMTGRGLFGLVAVVLVAGASAAILLRVQEWRPLSNTFTWTMAHLFGLATFVLSGDYLNLLIIAIALFLVGSFLGKKGGSSQLASAILGALTAAAILIERALRPRFWWANTDDFQILEVQMRHYTVSGVLAEWGSHDWSKYHWLSHGWGGLLNEFGARPDVFVTLTRVLPITYSISLAASAMLLTTIVASKSQSASMAMVPCWTLVALNRFDWSAPSTGGSLTVVVTATALAVLAVEWLARPLNRVMLYGILLAVSALTKLPSVFSVLPLFLAAECLIRYRGKSPYSQARLTSSILVLVFIALVPGLIVVSSVVGNGAFSFTSVNPMLGSISDRGGTVAFLLLLLMRLPLAALVLSVLATRLFATDGRSESMSTIFLGSLGIFVLWGTLLDVVISPINSNGHEYFSGPALIITSMALFTVASDEITDHKGHLRYTFVPIVTGFFLVGVLWHHLFTLTEIPEAVSAIFATGAQYANTIRYVIADPRTGAIMMGMILITLRRSVTQSVKRGLKTALLVALVLLTFQDQIPAVLDYRSEEADGSRYQSVYGDSDSQRVGKWLRDVSQPNDLIATNFLRDKSQLISDYSLALWSERTFHVLGPRFFRESVPQIQATRLSERYANSSTNESSRELWNAGVRWFVVDTTLTQRETWANTADVRFSSGRFTVLQLRQPS